MKLNKVVIILGKRLVHDQLSAEGRSRVEALVSVLNQWDFESTALVFVEGSLKVKRSLKRMRCISILVS